MGVHNLDAFVRQALAAHGYHEVNPAILVVTQITTVTHTFAPTGATGDEGRGRPVSTSAPETVLRIEVGDADSIPQHRFLLTASVDLQGAHTITALQAL
jgi:hypothetical protein